MVCDSGTFARASTGNATFLFPNESFDPSILLFWVAGKTSGDTETHFTQGYWHKTTSATLDGTLQASSGKSSETRSKTLSHYAGTTEKIAFTVTGTAAGEFSVNFTAADSSYNMHFLAIP